MSELITLTSTNLIYNFTKPDGKVRFGISKDSVFDGGKLKIKRIGKTESEGKLDNEIIIASGSPETFPSGFSQYCIAGNQYQIVLFNATTNTNIILEKF